MKGARPTIYLDNAATTKPDSDVIDELALRELSAFGNPSSPHGLADYPNELLAKAEENVRKAVGDEEGEGRVIFTSGGTEANNLALLGLSPVYLEHPWFPSHDSGPPDYANNVITSKTEHSSVLEPLRHLHKIHPWIHAIEALPGRKGYLSVRDITEHEWRIRDTYPIARFFTKIVSIMAVNNETGMMNDVEAIGEFCRENRLIFHTDCVQALGKISLRNFSKFADIITLSSHKIHGPKGVGALWVRKNVELSPILFGGDGIRPGTKNVPGINAFANIALPYACSMAEEPVVSYAQSLAEKFEQHLLEIPGAHLNFPNDEHHCPYIFSVRFDGVDAETLVLQLSNKGVYVSAGAACDSDSSEPSHVLIASGLTEDEARSTIRISASYDTSERDIVDACKIISETVRQLRSAGGAL